MFFGGQNSRTQVEETFLHDIRTIEERQKHTREYQEGSLIKNLKTNKEKRRTEKVTGKRMMKLVLTFKNQIVIMKTTIFL